jgi:hypothetical protein
MTALNYSVPILPDASFTPDARYEIRKDSPISARPFALYFEGKRFGTSAHLDHAEMLLWRHQLRNARAFRPVDGVDVWLTRGDVITDFRGNACVFDSISRMPIPGKSAKVMFYRSEEEMADSDMWAHEAYAEVFSIGVRVL